MKGIVKEVIEEAPRTVTFRVKTEKQASFKAGQFFMIGMIVEKAGERKFVKRAYSAASSPGNDLIDFTVRETEEGILSPALVNIEEGDELELDGPYGKFALEDEEVPEQITLIGAGSGMAPLRGILLRALEREPVPITLIYSEKTPNDLIYKRELEEWKHHVKMHVTITRPEGSEWEGPTGRLDAETLIPLVPNTKGIFFICGPPPMVKAMSEALMNLGVEKGRIKKEQYW